jgi:hypothetical protein
VGLGRGRDIPAGKASGSGGSEWGRACSTDSRAALHCEGSALRQKRVTMRNRAQADDAGRRLRKHGRRRHIDPNARLNVEGFLCHEITYPLQVSQTVKQNIGLSGGAAKSRQRAPVRHGPTDRE